MVNDLTSLNAKYGEDASCVVSNFFTLIAKLYDIHDRDKWDVSWQDVYRMAGR